MPVTLDGRLDLGLESKLRWGRDKYLQWVRKAVLISSLAERRKPGVRDTVMKHIDCMLVEGVLRPEQGHHMQQSELVLVEKSWGWESAREKVDSWGRGAGMKALESLEGGTVVEGEKFHFTGCEAESSQSTEQLRCRIGGLNP